MSQIINLFGSSTFLSGVIRNQRMTKLIYVTTNSNNIKEGFNEIFSGMFQKIPLNLFSGLGIVFFTVLVTDLENLNQVKQVGNNPFLAFVSHNPPLFWISFLVGFLWSNSMTKNLQTITLMKFIYRIPITIIWTLAIFLLSKKGL